MQVTAEQHKQNVVNFLKMVDDLVRKSLDDGKKVTCEANAGMEMAVGEDNWRLCKADGSFVITITIKPQGDGHADV